MEVDEPIEAGATVETGGVWLTVGGTILTMLENSGKQMKFRFTVHQVTYDDDETETFK